MKPLLQQSPWLRGASVLAVVFGLMTLKEGGTVLFGGAAARAAAGAYVPFVLWFNFLAGFAYVVAGIALWRRQRWAAGLALGIALATALVFAAFGIHVLTGGAYEIRTAAAMTLRTTVWLVIAALAWRMRPGRTA
ncbi:MAG: hypothetical protein KF695_04110 [Simplicispira sp.]|nr:hypothetical protein [Simplicispira sp.]